jgi:two-component system sensor histidine kinase KdpD
LFQRGANTDRVPGSGLGLAVVDGFARALGLVVTAENRHEMDKTLSGAIFTIHFPEPLLSTEKE